MAVLTPYIPTYITVHLGPPGSDAENITVPFTDYIKNVASGEIYPTWPDSALRANIYAIITFALNRVYTEWYPSQGYDFDITSTTAYDQSFSKNREIYENISQIVDEIFNNYVVRNGEVQPLFTQFCNGTTSTCAGLSQWGTVTLAERGLTPYEILQYYYGDDISIIENAPVQDIMQSYPGSPLVVGSAGNDVTIIQQQLNRIARNYPAIPRIEIPTGIYDNATRRSVEAFQQIFNLNVNGTVDKETWYKIKQYYNGVKRLGELASEGLTYDEVTVPFSTELSYGMSGFGVAVMQYYLNVIAYFNPSMNIFPINEIFDDATLNAVKIFQNIYGLPVTGVVDREMWDKIISVYNGIRNSLPEGYSDPYAKLYPGYILTPGSIGDNVRDLQIYLATIAAATGTLPPVPVTGVYDDYLRDVVYAYQAQKDFPLNGSVGAITWNSIARTYNDIIDARNGQ